MKKKVPSRPFFLDTRPLHQKQNFFLDWPYLTNTYTFLHISSLLSSLYIIRLQDPKEQ